MKASKRGVPETLCCLTLLNSAQTHLLYKVIFYFFYFFGSSDFYELLTLSEYEKGQMEIIFKMSSLIWFLFLASKTCSNHSIVGVTGGSQRQTQLFYSTNNHRFLTLFERVSSSGCGVHRQELYVIPCCPFWWQSLPCLVSSIFLFVSAC